MYKEFIQIAKKLYEQFNQKSQFNDNLQHIRNESKYEDAMLIEKHKDGIHPFKRSYLGYDEHLFEIQKTEKPQLEQNLVNKFIAEKRPLSPEKYNRFFKDFINVESFSQNGKIDILTKIWEDCKKIDQVLAPLNALNIPYSIDITGGAARDFILNREKNIKDIDFLIRIPKTPDLEEKLQTSNLLKDNLFTKTNLSFVQWTNTQDIDDAKAKLIKLCCNKAHLLTNYYNISSKTNTDPNNIEIPDSYDTILRERMYGIIKCKDASALKFNYPFDLLLSNMTKPTFLSHFDFDICKASFCIVNKAYKKEVPKEPLHLISRFSAPTEFWADVANKRITLNTYAKNEKMLQICVETHLPKFLKKYQGFEVGINELSEHSKQKSYIGAINSMIMNVVLQKNIKPQAQANKRIKI